MRDIFFTLNLEKMSSNSTYISKELVYYSIMGLLYCMVLFAKRIVKISLVSRLLDD